MTRGLARSWLKWIVGIVAVLLIVATLVPVFETDRWWVRIFVFPQIQFTILLLLVALAVPFVFGMKEMTPRLLLAAVAAALVYQLTYLLPFTPLWDGNARIAQSCPAEDRLRVLVLNVREGNEQADPVLRLVDEVDPDIFLAVETDSYWNRNLQPLEASLPHVVSAPRDDAWGLNLYSRLPLLSPEVRYLVEDYVPSIRTGVQLPSGETFVFYGLHPKPPMMHSSSKGDSEVARAAAEIGRSGEAAVLAGDLNDVPWGYEQDRFRRVSGMADPRLGRAFDATFKADNPLMRWPLDYVYFTPHFSLMEFEPLDDVGTDHFPLLAELCRAP